MKVALGAARGLAFLHNAEIKVIYRDFKTSNILLDSVCEYQLKGSLLQFTLSRCLETWVMSSLSYFQILGFLYSILRSTLTGLQCQAF